MNFIPHCPDPISLELLFMAVEIRAKLRKNYRMRHLHQRLSNSWCYGAREEVEHYF